MCHYVQLELIKSMKFFGAIHVVFKRTLIFSGRIMSLSVSFQFIFSVEFTAANLALKRHFSCMYH